MRIFPNKQAETVQETVPFQTEIISKDTPFEIYFHTLLRENALLKAELEALTRDKPKKNKKLKKLKELISFCDGDIKTPLMEVHNQVVHFGDVALFNKKIQQSLWVLSESAKLLSKIN